MAFVVVIHVMMGGMDVASSHVKERSKFQPGDSRLVVASDLGL